MVEWTAGNLGNMWALDTVERMAEKRVEKLVDSTAAMMAAKKAVESADSTVEWMGSETADVKAAMLVEKMVSLGRLRVVVMA